ncbi:MAG TPA: hypothetical protein VHX44_00550, partial [Planctomycetota bacterium]|nr:hypothetical protein [Planctomycetota bacterium]
LEGDDQPMTTTLSKAAVTAEPSAASVVTHQVPAHQTAEQGRKFSAELVASMQGSLLRGDLTLDELRFALGSATLRSEDDIRQVLAETIRLKQAIIALGADAQRLMKHVHPRTVAFLLRSWTTEHS